MLPSSSTIKLWMSLKNVSKFTQSTVHPDLSIHQWNQSMMNRRRLLACLCKHKLMSTNLCTHSFRKRQVR
nr:ORF3b protein [Bat SARS-like virus BtSY2]